MILLRKLEILVLLTLIKYFSVILPFITFFFIKEKKGYKRYFFWYSFFCIFNTVLTIYFYENKVSQFYIINNLIYTPVEFIFFSLIFIKVYSIQSNIKIVKYGFLIYFTFWAAITFVLKPTDFDSIAVAFEEIFIFIYALIYFYEKIKNPDTVFIYTSPAFWAVSALFIYASGTFFVYLFASSLWNDKIFEYQYDFVHLNISIIKNILITFSLLKKENQISHFSFNKSLK